MFLWGWVTPPILQVRRQVVHLAGRASYRMINQPETTPEVFGRNLLCVFRARETKKRLERKTPKLITWRFLGRGSGWVEGVISLICNSAVRLFL